ncbi:MAG: hypothetical protein E7302_12980 [Butyrivibrio sp.]|nr:hypothetical protein [Butyrivibrio sp.]
MKILDYFGKVREFKALWALNILSAAAWLIDGDMMEKAVASVLAILVILIIDIIFTENYYPYVRLILTITVVNLLAGFSVPIFADDPSFHGCLPPVFYIFFEMIMYMAVLIHLIIGGFVILMIKNAIVRKICNREGSTKEQQEND